jgi:hypothetical protein
MSANDERGRPETAQERHDNFLRRHQERMRKVDQTIEAIKIRAGRSGERKRTKRGTA